MLNWYYNRALKRYYESSDRGKAFEKRGLPTPPDLTPMERGTIKFFYTLLLPIALPVMLLERAFKWLRNKLRRNKQ